MVTNSIIDILISKIFQFMKVNILKINHKVVATVFLRKTICATATPMTQSIATHAIYKSFFKCIHYLSTLYVHSKVIFMHFSVHILEYKNEIVLRSLIVLRNIFRKFKKLFCVCLHVPYEAFYNVVRIWKCKLPNQIILFIIIQCLSTWSLRGFKFNILNPPLFARINVTIFQS